MAKSLFKKITIGVLTAVMALSLASCGSSDKSKEASGEKSGVVSDIKESGKLILATNPEFAPFEFVSMKDGKEKIIGADIMFAEEIAKDLGVKLEIRSMNFNGLIEALNAGNCDMVIAGMNPTPDRKKSVAFSELYYGDSPQVILINNKDADKIKTKEDLKGLKIGAQKGSVQEEVIINELKDSTLHAIPNIPNLIQELKNSQIDAIVLEKPVAEQALKSVSEDIQLAPFEINVDYSGYAVAIKKGNEDLVEEVNKTIKRIETEKLMDSFIKEAEKLVDKK